MHVMGWSPLIFAIEAGRPRTVQLLLRQGASLDHITLSQTTPLDHALMKDDLAIIAVIMSHLKDFDLDRRGVFGYMEKSDHFYGVAQRQKTTTPDVACFCAHQAAEMALHAALALNGYEGKHHHLLALLEDCVADVARDTEVRSAVVRLSCYYLFTRYPHVRLSGQHCWEEQDETKAEKAIEDAGVVRAAAVDALAARLALNKEQ
jgi:HEPN domain-containing protein